MSLGDPCSRDHHIVPGRQNGRASDINEDGAGSSVTPSHEVLEIFLTMFKSRGGFHHLHLTETPAFLHTFLMEE